MYLRRLSGRLSHRLRQTFWYRQGGQGATGAQSASADAATLTNIKRVGRSRIRPRPSPSVPQYLPPPTTTSIDIARFGLLSVVTLPFTVWIACFTYDYVYRIEICQEAIGKQDEGLKSNYQGSSRAIDGTSKDATEKSNNKSTANTTTLLGRDNELAEVSALLDNEPSQIIVIAGGNEAGKSRFVSELLRNQQHQSRRGVTYVQLAALVDSVSSFTQVLVNAFDLRWLHLRHALVDVLPFAGSEILVMKERFGDRDLAQGLCVITDALKRNAASAAKTKRPRPVLVIDGFGEGPGQWMSSSEGKLLAQRFLQWCIYVTKEHRLAHVVLTGNEQLVLSLTDQNRITRGHVKVVGLGDLSLKDAAQIVRMELSDATDEEIRRITSVFGGFIHDVKGVSRDIQYRLTQEGLEAATVGSKRRKTLLDDVVKARFQQQVERVIAAFAQGKEKDDSAHERGIGGSVDEDDDKDPYLDPLKSIYSEAQARQLRGNGSESDESNDDASWTQLQLWKTLERLVESPQMAVPFSELRDDIFDGDKRPILELMMEDVLGFQVDRSSDGGWFWKVTPASPALGKAFEHLVDDGGLKKRFEEIETAEEQIEERKEIELERARLYRERKNLDLRKKSLLRTVELGRELGRDELARTRLARSFETIVAEEEMHDEEDRVLKEKLSLLMAGTGMEGVVVGSEGESSVQRDTTTSTTHDDHIPLRSLLKEAFLDIISTEDAGDDNFLRLKDAFKLLDETNDGKISAADLARVVKAATGKEVDMKDAHNLVAEWDLNDDRSLDYNEFARMLLADNKSNGKRKDG